MGVTIGPEIDNVKRDGRAGKMKWTRLGLFVAAIACVGCARTEPIELPDLDQTRPSDEAMAALERLNEEFQRKVYTVTDGVYQAVGFGIANSIMVEGDDCVFVVDVMGSMETAKSVKAEFDKNHREADPRADLHTQPRRPRDGRAGVRAGRKN